MTTVAYRDGVLCSDSSSNYNGLRWASVPKIGRAPDGTMGGASGDSGMCDEFRRWIEAGASADLPSLPPEQVTAFIVRPDGTMAGWDGREMYQISGAFIAVGSGAAVAMGAMAAGASARRAVEIAIALDSGSAGPIQELRAVTVAVAKVA